MSDAPRPGYSQLTPEQVLASLAAAGFAGDGRFLQLNSYENRVFQVFLDSGEAVVAKFYRPGRWSDAAIVEEHAFALELAREEVPVVAPLEITGEASPLARAGSPPTLAITDDAAGVRQRFGVWPRRAGREPELEDEAVLRRLGTFIARLHRVGARRPFRERATLDAPADARRAIDTVEAAGAAIEAPPDWHRVAREAAAGVAAAFAAARAAPSIRLHGDCHRGNVLWRDGTPNLVDLDDAFAGPAVQDLWMLAGGGTDTSPRAWALLLDGYRDAAGFDDAQLALVEPLRTLRMLRHSAWLAARWHDPAFPAAFPFFGTPAYWREQATQLREQCEAMAR
jgi:Ser/Thr protein kinase RdoA (MazF antagonist)